MKAGLKHTGPDNKLNGYVIWHHLS